MRILCVGLGLRYDVPLLIKFLFELFGQYILPIGQFDISYATFAHQQALRLDEFLLLALAQINREFFCSFMMVTGFSYKDICDISRCAP